MARPYAEGLLGDWPRTGDLEEMLSLLLTPAPGETPPKALHEQVYTTPSEVTDSMQELARLRTQVADLTAAVEGLRAQMGSAQTQVTHLEEQLPERLGPRLADLEGHTGPSSGPGTRTGTTGTEGPDQHRSARRSEPPSPRPNAARSPRPRTQKPGETP